MRWHKHMNLEGLHSQHLSASKPHWLGYDDDKFDRVFVMRKASERGTRLHEFAAMAIELGQPLRSNRTTISMYVNDSIGFRMKPEQTLMYSLNAFGTPDAISYRKGVLRIHDLKTGTALASFRQLKCYAALFFLEYLEDPFKTKIILRIYQNDTYVEEIADPGDIHSIMLNYKRRDKRIDLLMAEEDEL